jgi:putative ABC transport system ATP-binding protein
MTDNPIVQVKQVHKKFQMDAYEVHALKGVDLDVHPGEFLAISGSSGSGKTTLLNLIGCIDHPTVGHVFFEDQDVNLMDDRKAARLRAEKIGFVFQTFNLIPVLSALENVEYPLFFLNHSSKQRRELCNEALERVGLSRFVEHRPSQLSGGQRQRVAIARALVKRPALILADECTANLDAKTASEVIDLMEKLNTEDKITFVFSSHDPMVLKRAKRNVHLADGLRQS